MIGQPHRGIVVTSSMSSASLSDDVVSDVLVLVLMQEEQTDPDEDQQGQQDGSKAEIQRSHGSRSRWTSKKHRRAPARPKQMWPRPGPRFLLTLSCVESRGPIRASADPYRR